MCNRFNRSNSCPTSCPSVPTCSTPSTPAWSCQDRESGCACDWDCRRPCKEDFSCSCDCPRPEPVCPATLIGQVLEVRCGSLLVCDCQTGQQVQVNTDDACAYQVGDRIRVHYNGAMTNSLPPQISADCIEKVGRCAF